MQNEYYTNRLQTLLLVLQYTYDTRMLTTGEKICINQERGAIMRLLAHRNNECPIEEVSGYRIPDAIETKVQAIVSKIPTGWTPKKFKY